MKHEEYARKSAPNTRTHTYTYVLPFAFARKFHRSFFNFTQLLAGCYGQQHTHTHIHTIQPNHAGQATPNSHAHISHRNIVHCVPQARLYAIRLTFSPRPGKPSGQIGARFPFAVSCPFHALSPTLSQPRRKLKCCHSTFRRHFGTAS